MPDPVGLGSPARLSQCNLHHQRGDGIGVAFECSPDRVRSRIRDRREGSSELIEDTHANLTAPSLLVDLNFSMLPARPDVVERGGDHLITDVARRMAAQVQVEDQSCDLLFVPGLERRPHPRPRPLDGLPASARGGGKSEYLGADNRIASLPEELQHAIEGNAPVPPCGSDGGHGAFVAPAFERRLADPDGSGDLSGCEQVLHGLVL